MATQDYAVTMQDSSGRVYVMPINGACIDESMADGASESEAYEGVEGNAFANAIEEGRIGADALMTSTTSTRA